MNTLTSIVAASMLVADIALPVTVQIVPTSTAKPHYAAHVPKNARHYVTNIEHVLLNPGQKKEIRHSRALSFYNQFKEHAKDDPNYGKADAYLRRIFSGVGIKID